MSFAPPRRRAHTSQRATGRIGAFSNTATLAVALALVIPPVAAADDPPASAGWHGRAIQDPQPRGDSVTTADATPSGWSAGPVRLGTGFHHQGGSERVREVQNKLWALGYRPGPVDGLFGPQTQGAVEWFQIKHGLQPDGVVDVPTLTLLRERTGATPGAGSSREPVRGGLAARGNAPQPRPAAQPADRGEKPAGDGGRAFPRGFAALALLLLAVPAALALIALSRSRRTRTHHPRGAEVRRNSAAPAGRNGAGRARPAADGKVAAGSTARPAANGKVAAGPAPEAPAAASPERSPAIGYVRTAAGDRAELARHAGAIRQACTGHGWKLAELVRDDQSGAGRPFERPGLAAAMQHLSGQGPSRLVVSKLAHLSRSPADLTALFEWFGRHEVQVIAADVGLDTTTPEGRRAAESQLAAYARRYEQLRATGQNGANGRNGADDQNGANGRSNAASGDSGANGQNGANGQSGAHRKVEVAAGGGHDDGGDGRDRGGG